MSNFRTNSSGRKATNSVTQTMNEQPAAFVGTSHVRAEKAGLFHPGLSRYLSVNDATPASCALRVEEYPHSSQGSLDILECCHGAWVSAGIPGYMTVGPREELMLGESRSPVCRLSVQCLTHIHTTSGRPAPDFFADLFRGDFSCKIIISVNRPI
jgi:hypothetical protein